MLRNVIKDEIKVPGHIDYLGDLRNFVTKTGKKHGFSDSIVNAFKLSIDEAATNIIKHAYREKEGMITMRIIIKKNSMTIILIDQGKYFHPARVQDPDLKRYVDIGKKGGLGIFIIRKLIDEIDYRHTEEGNELRLTKYRDGKFTKSEVPSPAAATSTLSMSLKSKYSLVAAAILTFMITMGYLYFYYSNGKQIVNEILELEKTNSENISRVVLQPGENSLNTIYINTHLNEAIDLSENEEIYRLLIIDSDGLCIYSNDDEAMYTTISLPENYRMIEEGVYRYTLDKNNIEIYDIVSPILNFNDVKLGETHLQIKSDFIKKKVNVQRAEDLRLAVLILLMGYLGVAILIYIVMNPFRKLSDWVKQLGHGEVKDEIDFDTGNELGEIAKAFSEITDKFRKSQENLAEQERLQKEMQLAQDIQQTLLPPYVPEIEGYKIASYYEAAKEVGGDYYDFVEVDKDSLGIVVADVSGKGVPGSLIMTMIRTALRTEARGVKSASEVLGRLNDFVVKDMKKGMFVTIFYVIIDSKKRRLNYASAGHNPMILYRQSTKKTYYLNPKGFPVGISLPDQELFKKSIESDTIQMAEDDILLIYTDGITEAMNNQRELFGEERLLDVIRNNSHLQVDTFIEKIQEEMYSFSEGFEQSDDITLLAIKEKSSPEKIELNRAQKAHKLILNNTNIKEACEEAGITTYAYYNKYKKIFEEEGLDAYSIDDTISVEAKHLSIEEKTKIYDIIKTHPEYGAKRINEELNSEKYSFTQINESRIYDELVRSRLNTKQLREAYVARAGKKKRMKPPGTPMLTLDGRIIHDREKYEQRFEDVDVKDKPSQPKKIVKLTSSDETETKSEEKEIDPTTKGFDDDFYIESMMSVPIENLLDKNRKDEEADSSTYSGVEDIVSEDVEDDESELEETVEHDDIFEDDATNDTTDELELEKSSETGDDLDFDFEDTMDEIASLYSESNDNNESPESVVGNESIDEDEEIDYSEDFGDTITFLDHGSEETEDSMIDDAGDEASAESSVNDLDIASDSFSDHFSMEEEENNEFASGDYVNEDRIVSEPGDDLLDLPDEHNYEAEFSGEQDLDENEIGEIDFDQDKSIDDAIFELDNEEPENGTDHFVEDQDKSESGEVLNEQDSLKAMEKGDEIEDDFSFKDIWADDDEGSIDENIEIIDSDSNVDDLFESSEDTNDNGDESNGDDEIDFENIVDDGDIESNLTFENKEGNGKQTSAMDENEKFDSKSDIEVDNIFDESPEKEPDTNIDDDLERDEEEIDSLFTGMIDSQEIEEDEEDLDHLSFSDLLEEIENDVTFMDSTENGIYTVSENELDLERDFENSDNSDNYSDYNTDDSVAYDKILKERHLLSGLKYYKSEEYDKAIKEFNQVLELYPDFKEIHTIMGNAYYKNDRAEDALREYLRVLEIDPYDVDAYENVGIIYANWGDFAKAINEWEKLLEIDPNRMDIRKNVEKAKTILEKVNHK